MGDGANDALRGYIKAGMPRGGAPGKPCPHCGTWSYTSNQCHPEQSIFCTRATTLPKAHNGCTCACHSQSGIIHFVACCTPTQPEPTRGQSDEM